MTQGPDTDRAAEPSARPRPALVAMVIAALDLALVSLLLLLDRDQVQSPEELERVGLGLPLPWVTQSQSVDPPLPWRTGLLTPWEHPATVEWWPLVTNLVIVGLLLTALWALVRALRAAPAST